MSNEIDDVVFAEKANPVSSSLDLASVASGTDWEIDDKSFQPTWWLRGAHQQTIFGSYLAAPELRNSKKIRVPLDDGDSVMLHQDLPEDWVVSANGKPIVLVSIHGLGGCHRSGYVRRLAGLAVNAGWGSYRMDMRGAGESGRESEFLYHAGRSDDLLAAIKRVKQEHPHANIVVCGFSLGASITLHLMSYWAREIQNLVSAAIAVAPPLDLQGCADNLSYGWNRIYDRKFAKMLWQSLQQRPNVLRRFRDILPSVPPRTLLDFDNQVTAPLGGYESAQAYYQQFSTGALLGEIQGPTLIITSKDDPLIPYRVFQAVENAPAVQLCATEAGGHLGFVGGQNSRNSEANGASAAKILSGQPHQVSPNRWLERSIIRAISRRFKPNCPE